MLYELGARHVFAPAQKVIIHARRSQFLDASMIATISHTPQPHRLPATPALAAQVSVWMVVRPSVQQAGRLGLFDPRNAAGLPFPLAEYFTFQAIAVSLESAAIRAYRCGMGIEWDERGRVEADETEGGAGVERDDEDGRAEEKEGQLAPCWGRNPIIHSKRSHELEKV
jgi:hypothetical protein